MAKSDLSTIFAKYEDEGQRERANQEAIPRRFLSAPPKVGESRRRIRKRKNQEEASGRRKKKK